MQETLISLDFETYFDSECTLKKLSVPEYVAHPKFKVHMVSIKINNGDVALIDAPDIPATLKYLKETYPCIRLIAQNTMFDGYILHKIYDWHPDFYSDTMAMSRGVTPHASASLKNILCRIFPYNEALRKGEELIKSMGVVDLHAAGLFNSIGKYCKMDTALCYLIYDHLKSKLPKDEMTLIDLLLKMFCKPKLQLDIPLLKQYKTFLESERESIIKKSNVDPKILSSNKQLDEYIRIVLKLETPTKISPRTGLVTPALAKNDIKFQNFQKKHPELSDLWAARAAVKSTIGISRVQRFIDIGHATGGEMPVYLAFSAAHTHRLGGGDRTNLQNLPRNAPESHPDGDLRPGVLRRALIAPAGHVVHVRDLSNIEARLSACISGQMDLLEIFRTGGDPYAAMASRIYGRNIDKKTDPLERGVGKVAVLGLGYGMSGDTFKNTLNSGPIGMPPVYLDHETDYNRIVYDVYRKVNRNIVNFWDTCNRFIYWMATCKENDEPLVYKCLSVYKDRILLPSGLELQYPNLRQSNGQWVYDAKNGSTNIYGGKLAENIMQALAQIIIKANMLSVQQAFPEITIALQVHDEIVSVIPEDIVKEVDAKIAEIMAIPPIWLPELPLNSDGGWAKNYIK